LWKYFEEHLEDLFVLLESQNSTFCPESGQALAHQEVFYQSSPAHLNATG